MDAALWIGPVIVAAAISSVVTVIGWFVSHERERRLEARRRQEKIRDLQSALLAEIAGNMAQSADVDLDRHAFDMQIRMSESKQYTPFVPRDAGTIVFDAILPEIHVVPSRVIVPTVSYYKQIARIGYCVDDLRTERFSLLAADRKTEMYLEYLGMIRKASRLAREAKAALEKSLAS